MNNLGLIEPSVRHGWFFRIRIFTKVNISTKTIQKGAYTLIYIIFYSVAASFKFYCYCFTYLQYGS